MKVGDAAGAAAWYQRAIDAGGATVPLMLRLTEAQIKSGALDRARTTIAGALELDPANADARAFCNGFADAAHLTRRPPGRSFQDILRRALMVRYLFRRLLLTFPVLLGVATLVFALIHLVPGDPAQAMLGEGASQEEIVKLQHTLGLDRPLLSQYRSFLAGVAHGDLGTSFRYNAPVAAQIRDKFPNTAALALAAMLVAVVLAIPLGIVAAVLPRDVRRSRRDDAGAARHLACRTSGSARCWRSSSRSSSDGCRSRARGRLSHLVLPAVTLGAALAAILARMTRASVLEELRELYVLAARARGLSRRTRGACTTRSATA